MATTLRQLLQSHNLPQLIAQATAHLESETERRQKFYDDIDETVKAEFINGQMVLHSPVMRRHNMARKRLMKIVDTYVDRHGLGEVQDEKIMVHLTRNSFEPDIAFWRKEVAAEFYPKQMLFPAPDFVVEVLSESTEKIDRKVKMEDYALHGVREYWLIDPEAETIEQYLLPEGKEKFELHSKVGTDNSLESVVISGFRIPVKAVFDGEANVAALAVLMGRG